MRRLLIAALAAASLVWMPIAEAATHRGWRAPYEFKNTVPCPSTGTVGLPCPGYVIDHIIPLACDGPDEPENLQWQKVEDAKAKDKVERECWRYFSPYYKPYPLKRT